MPPGTARGCRQWARPEKLIYFSAICVRSSVLSPSLPCQLPPFFAAFPVGALEIRCEITREGIGLACSRDFGWLLGETSQPSERGSLHLLMYFFSFLSLKLSVCGRSKFRSEGRRGGGCPFAQKYGVASKPASNFTVRISWLLGAEAWLSVQRGARCCCLALMGFQVTAGGAGRMLPSPAARGQGRIVSRASALLSEEPQAAGFSLLGHLRCSSL